MRVEATCDRVLKLCGCATWLELESGRWVRRSWPCNRHESAATEEGAA